MISLSTNNTFTYGRMLEDPNYLGNSSTEIIILSLASSLLCKVEGPAYRKGCYVCHKTDGGLGTPNRSTWSPILWLPFTIKASGPVRGLPYTAVRHVRCVSTVVFKTVESQFSDRFSAFVIVSFIYL
jgi:hypothetical protein